MSSSTILVEVDEEALGALRLLAGLQDLSVEECAGQLVGLAAT